MKSMKDYVDEMMSESREDMNKGKNVFTFAEMVEYFGLKMCPLCLSEEFSLDTKLMAGIKYDFVCANCNRSWSVEIDSIGQLTAKNNDSEVITIMPER